MNFNKYIFVLFLLVFSCTAGYSANTIDLKGKWAFQTDSADLGEKQRWYQNTLKGQITLPGSMAENNIGEDVRVDTKWTGTNWSDSSWYKRPDFAKYRIQGKVKVSFWLTPQKIYVGPAWYQKQVVIPENWTSKQIFLNLERCHWETKVWVDNANVGMNNSLSTPHLYNLSDVLKPGKHSITVRIDNRVKEINPGLDAHSISDNTQTNWNGIVGNISLQLKNNIFVSKLKVTPDLKSKHASVELTVLNNSGAAISKEVRLVATGYNSKKKHVVTPVQQSLQLQPGANNVTIELPMGDDFQTWDEFSPSLYKLTAEILNTPESTKSVTFGMREIKAVGTQFYINGIPIFLRGTLECAIFPKTGYPPTDKNSWKKIMRQMQNHGLNHIRFHSWCPPKAAFDAADEMGMYFQIENDAWATIGNGESIDNYIYDESNRIVEEYGNHPCFCLMAYGNEPHGDSHAKYLSKFVSYWKNKDHRRVYTSAAGWPEIPENDYHNIPAPRIQHWNEGLKSIINAKAPQTANDYSKIIKNKKIPVVSHEIGQWCVFPNFAEMKKYTGVLKPKNFELFKEDLADHHMADQAHDFLMASGKLQALCYKADIEAALRSKGMAGFHLLDLHDFPGQGTALVGVLDAFWKEKGYISPSEFNQFCNKIVPLARMDKMIFSTADTLNAVIEIANFSGAILSNSIVKWEIKDCKNKIVRSGSFDSQNYPIGNGLKAGSIHTLLNDLKSPSQYVLRTFIEGTKITNQWDIWIYPTTLPDNKKNVIVTNKFDDETIKLLSDGKNVLLTVDRSMLKPEKGGKIDFGFSTVFWNTSWTKNQAPQTLGILCNPKHPALANFPTQYHSNWQWWDIIKHAGVMNIDDFPADYKSIIQPIDTWFDNRKLALIIEAKVLNGRLLMTSIDFTSDMENRLSSRQLKYSLLEYMNGADFNPVLNLDAKVITDFLKK